ncbi:unnamed protein product [Durusdinium trenchii]|uniref:DUF4201 domain-containing protein n=1 Tax=Durusdinium trenchii TaxID=1381693 RepID=A0ABP0RN85_9DINO
MAELHPEPPPLDPTLLRGELQRLRGEYDSLKAAAEEAAACPGLEVAGVDVRLHDLRLERLALKALLDRYRERPPKVDAGLQPSAESIGGLSVQSVLSGYLSYIVHSEEELAERYESEIDQFLGREELSEELRQLQEENALLAYHAACDDEASPAPTPSASARTPRTTVGSAQRRSARQVKEQAKEVRQCEAQLMALRRRTRVNEWYLVPGFEVWCVVGWEDAQLKTQLQETGKLLQGRESCLKDLKERIDQAHADRRRLSGERVRTQQTLETERQELVQLHQEALSLREACYLPAQLKKKSSMLTKFLDQEGGRLQLEKHLRASSAVQQLYRRVGSEAPEATALAGRVKADMEAACQKVQDSAGWMCCVSGRIWC